MEMLTTKQVSLLMNCDDRKVQRWAKEGKLSAETTYNKQNRPKYLIPITALDIKLQAKYHKQQGEALSPIPMPSNKVEGKPFDCYSDAERKEIGFWIDTIEKWLEYRNKSTKSKAEVDNNFVAMMKLENPDLDISTDTLYRRLNAYKTDNLDGLIDKRGKWKNGQSTVLEPMWEAFIYYYLDEAKLPVTACYQNMTDVVKDKFPELFSEIPNIASFRRRIIADLPPQLKTLGREGEKAWRDAYCLYIRRKYDDMNSNDYWIGDTHTLDVQSRAEDGSIHRLYLSAFLDARSGVFVGWHISTSPSSQTTLLALRHGMQRCKCIPDNIYVDNGREFLTHDVGGLGHRKRKSKDGIEAFEPPPVFKRLGIKMTNALVENARAKSIERRFKDVKDQVSRLFESYTGGNVMERPERLKAHIKNGEVVIDKDLIEQVNTLIEFSMNYEAYNGTVKADCGKRKIDVYNEHFGATRNASEEVLNLMLMRSSRVQTVGRRGVHLEIYGERIDYFNQDLRSTMMGKKVYYRYDPADLSEVRIYDLQDRYIMSVPADSKLIMTYGADKSDIKEAQQIIRKAERVDMDKLKKIKSVGYKSARELSLARAIENKNNPAAPANPKVINIHRADEQPLYKAVGGGYPDLKVMTANAIKRQEEQA